MATFSWLPINMVISHSSVSLPEVTTPCQIWLSEEWMLMHKQSEFPLCARFGNASPRREDPTQLAVDLPDLGADRVATCCDPWSGNGWRTLMRLPSFAATKANSPQDQDQGCEARWSQVISDESLWLPMTCCDSKKLPQFAEKQLGGSKSLKTKSDICSSEQCRKNVRTAVAKPPTTLRGVDLLNLADTWGWITT